jgi:hypothetical protein
MKRLTTVLANDVQADEHGDRVTCGTDRRSVLHYTGSDLGG